MHDIHYNRPPIGRTIRLDRLARDPYPVYALLREREPVSWVPALNMWYVTRHADVRRVLLDTEHFTTAWEESTIFDTFGRQMLTTEGAEHDRYRRATQKPFMPANIRLNLEAAIAEAADSLIAGFGATDHVELRSAYASRLPIQTMLLTFGMPLADEGRLRAWYDDFERGLSNFTGDPAVRAAARASAAAFHDHLDAALDEARATGETQTLLGTLANAGGENALAKDEIKRNMSIIFFGGISTVEALILNTVWALAHHRAVYERVAADLALLPKLIDETMRWLGPVQSATRHVISDIDFAGVRFRAGDVVNCMLGAANHDPSVFPEPGRFDIDRPNIGAHLGFATGPHMCLGFRLAKAEARIALEKLLLCLPRLHLIAEGTEPPHGYEFRQPPSLTIAWSGARN